MLANVSSIVCVIQVIILFLPFMNVVYFFYAFIRLGGWVNISADDIFEIFFLFFFPTVSRQFSIREIGNFGTVQLRDMDRIQ